MDIIGRLRGLLGIPGPAPERGGSEAETGPDYGERAGVRRRVGSLPRGDPGGTAGGQEELMNIATLHVQVSMDTGWWATYYRTPRGNLKRLVDDEYLPERCRLANAEADLRSWLDLRSYGGPTQKERDDCRSRMIELGW